MSHVIIDLKASVRSFVRNKSTIFWTIAFPCVLILLFGAIFSYSSVKYDLYIQNQDTINGKATIWSQNLVDILNGTYTNTTQSPFNIHIIDPAMNATDYAITNRLTSLIVIPAGFDANCTVALATNGKGAVANVTYIYDQSTTSGSIVYSVVVSIVNQINFGLSHGTQYLGVLDLTIAPKRYGYIDFFLPGMIGVTAMTTSIFTSVSISAQFKKNGVFHKLATTPLKRYEWILSRTIYNVFITFLGMSVMIILGITLFSMKITIDAVSIFMVIMASLMFTGLGMIIARFVKDPDGADAAANAITFPMMFLSGTFFPLGQMPLFLQAVAQVLPLTYVSDGLRASMIFGDAHTAIIKTGIITILGLLCIVVGSWITRWEED